MSLAVSQVRLLTLTSRKSSLETQLSINAMRKMEMAREMSQLSSDYNSKLSQLAVVYYANGKDNKINYSYLMGYYDLEGSTMANRTKPVKSNMSMVLTDFRGQVVLSKEFVDAIMAVCPNVSYNGNQGGTFDKNKIPEILAAMFPRGRRNPDLYRNGIENYTYTVGWENALDGTPGGSEDVDGADQYNEYINNIVSFYYPILLAAATNGWTTEYNNEMGQNEDYLTDALTSGIFCLSTVDENGYYEEGTSLNYYAIAGDIDLRTDSDKRETITAWYDAEKERIAQKETMIDTDIEMLSTQLEAIKTEMESVKTFIDDAAKIFSWGSNA